jgi:hypothetical protein
MVYSEGDAPEGPLFSSCFEDLPDYRQNGKVAYPLDEVLLLMLAAALPGRRRWPTPRASAERNWCSCGFRPFVDGTPSQGQLGIMLAKLDPVAFQRCFVAWTAVIAIDGKTVRRSLPEGGAEEPIHAVSAFPARQRWCSADPGRRQSNPSPFPPC